MRVCPQCGARYDDGAGYCPMDGAVLQDESPPASFVFRPPGGGDGSEGGGESEGGDEPVEAETSTLPGSDDAQEGAVTAQATTQAPSSEPAPQPAARPSSQPQAAAGASSARWLPSGGGGEAAASPRAREGSGPRREPSATSNSRARWLAAPVNSDPPLDSDKAEEPLTGIVLGERYRIDSLIGAGGMGVVYKATHVHIGRPIAVKVLRRRFAAKLDLAMRFTAEARVASTLDHPNVIDIIDIGETPQGSPYFVMEYLSGRTLAREIRTRGAMEVGRAIDIGCEIAQGLSAIHKAGIVHRDLKPDNVFLTHATEQAPERIKILDFGVALDPSRKQRLTKVGSVLGTPEYMSPEQARGEDLDGRSDLYALGVVLFEALSGQVPLTSDSQVGTLTKQAFEAAPSLRVIDARMAEYPTLEGVVSQLLAKDRRNRPANALDAIELLEAAAERDLGPRPPTPRRRPSSAPAPRSTAGPSNPSPPAGGEGNAPAASGRRPRRSTIVIGSGAVSSAHPSAEPEVGSATGDFTARDVFSSDIDHDKRWSPTPDAQPGRRRRPSVIVQGVETITGQRPARIVNAEPVANRVQSEDERAAEAAPAPSGLRAIAPMIVLALCAALFASLLTVAFVRWFERREAREGEPTGMLEGMPPWISSDRVARRPTPS